VLNNHITEIPVVEISGMKVAFHLSVRKFHTLKNLLKSPAVKYLSLKRREIDEAIEVAKIYKTDVYWEGKIAWSYSDWVKSKKGI
tara:strand:+ start:216 stop:470 length:255 start_codon:yes stop_codon:yes gene_type:complete